MPSMRVTIPPKIAIPVILLAAISGLYGWFIDNPLVFDDIYFFQLGNPEKVAAAGFSLKPRWLSDYSLALIFQHFGSAIAWQRAINLLIHAATCTSLFFLCRMLLIDMQSTRSSDRATWVAGAATLLFAVHPVAVFAVGYLIQRSILMATLFAVLTWIAFWLGLRGSKQALLLSIGAYVLAVLSKEHAVMVPAVCALLLVLHRRSVRAHRWTYPQMVGYFGTIAVIGLLVVLRMKGVLGTAYEPDASLAMGASKVRVSGPDDHLSSILTQASLFFQYLSHWLLPNQAAMSADMRVPLLDAHAGWSAYTGVAAVAIMMTFGLALLWQGGSVGLLGLALLAPSILFATEYSTVRVQEVFVLYRSYLWAPMLVLLPALALLRMSRDLGVALAAVLACSLGLMALAQLGNFSSSFQLWDTAARLAERSGNTSNLSGMDRIYRNRGSALAEAGLHGEAIDDFTRALAADENFVFAYQSRGTSYLAVGDFDRALDDFDKVISIDPKTIKGYAGRALALDGLGRKDEAGAAHRLACEKGWADSCPLVTQPSQQ